MLDSLDKTIEYTQHIVEHPRRPRLHRRRLRRFSQVARLCKLTVSFDLGLSRWARATLVAINQIFVCCVCVEVR